MYNYSSRDKTLCYAAYALSILSMDVGWHSVQTDVCDPALHVMGHFLMFPVLWKTIFWNNYA